MHPALFLARVKVACNTTTLSNCIICLVTLKKQQYAGFQLQKVAGNNSAFFFSADR